MQLVTNVNRFFEQKESDGGEYEEEEVEDSAEDDDLDETNGMKLTN